MLIYQIGLTLIPNVGDIKARRLIAYCGSAEAVFKEKKANLLKIPDIGPTIADAIAKQTVLSRAEKEIEFINKNNIQVLYYQDENYPKNLKHCNDSPILLYFKGNCNLNNDKIISIVGTRSATGYGKNFCEKLIEEISEYKVLIISGLAYGIDITSHEAAIKNNLPTVGVLAHGLGTIYPAAHKKTAQKMLENGGLITEYLSNTKPEKEHFPARNRIIAGLSHATIVIESRKKGGALITAEIANSYNRDVFAVPGRTTDVFSEGCNFLIKTHKAAILTSAEDLIYSMGWEKPELKKCNQTKLFIELTNEEKLVYEYLQQKQVAHFEQICYDTSLTHSILAATLLSLEFNNLVKCLPGKMYQVL